MTDHRLAEIGHAAADAGAWARSDALELEFLTLSPPPRGDLDILRSEGVTDAVLCAADTMTKSACVSVDRMRFEFDEAGERLFINAIRDIRGAVVDLVAWKISPPIKARLEGRGFALGEAAVANPASYFADSALQVFRSPLGWLKAGGRGICIVDGATVYDRLRDVPRVAGEDLEHARQLRNAIVPPRPTARVVISKTTMERAA